MARDPIIESHIAQSKAKIEKAAPDTVAAERHIDRTQRALERSRELLESARDPLQLVKLKGAAADRQGPAPKKPAAPKAKAKRRG